MAEESTEKKAPQGKSMYKYIAEAWADSRNTYVKALNQERRIKWRSEENFLRIEKPTRLDRAHALGYKAKQGYVLVRAKVRKGAYRKRHINTGRERNSSSSANPSSPSPRRGPRSAIRTSRS